MFALRRFCLTSACRSPYSLEVFHLFVAIAVSFVTVLFVAIFLVTFLRLTFTVFVVHVALQAIIIIK